HPRSDPRPEGEAAVTPRRHRQRDRRPRRPRHLARQPRPHHHAHRTRGAEGITRQRIADVSFIVWLAAFTVCVFALPFGAQIVAGASGLVVVAAYTVGWLASPAAHDIPPRKAHPAAVETCVECAGTGWLLDQAYGIASI